MIRIWHVRESHSQAGDLEKIVVAAHQLDLSLDFVCKQVYRLFFDRGFMIEMRNEGFSICTLCEV